MRRPTGCLPALCPASSILVHGCMRIPKGRSTIMGQSIMHDIHNSMVQGAAPELPIITLTRACNRMLPLSCPSPYRLSSPQGLRAALQPCAHLLHSIPPAWIAAANQEAWKPGRYHSSCSINF